MHNKNLNCSNRTRLKQKQLKIGGKKKKLKQHNEEANT